MTQIWVDFKQLSPSAVDVAQKAADYCYPRTLTAAWEKVYAMLDIEEIGRCTFESIVDNVSFFFPEDSDMIAGTKTTNNYMSHKTYDEQTK